MTTVRQDSWSSDEDLILAEVVLRHIREGSTQLAAFEEVGERLQRTSAACGFRWNSTIRKKYEAAITLAKNQRKKSKENKKEAVTPTPLGSEEFSTELESGQTLPENSEAGLAAEEKREASQLTLSDVITFLQQIQETSGKNETMARENKALKLEIETLKTKNNSLVKEIEKIKKEKEIISEDYQMLINIMERARKMSTSEK